MKVPYIVSPAFRGVGAWSLGGRAAADSSSDQDRNLKVGERITQPAATSTAPSARSSSAGMYPGANTSGGEMAEAGMPKIRTEYLLDTE